MQQVITSGNPIWVEEKQKKPDLCLTRKKNCTTWNMIFFKSIEMYLLFCKTIYIDRQRERERDRERERERQRYR